MADLRLKCGPHVYTAAVRLVGGGTLPSWIRRLVLAAATVVEVKQPSVALCCSGTSTCRPCLAGCFKSVASCSKVRRELLVAVCFESHAYDVSVGVVAAVTSK